MESFSKLQWLKRLQGHTPQNGMSHARFRVLMEIYNFTDGEGEGAHPGPARISANTGIHTTDVKRHIKALKDAKWIIRSETGGSKNGRRTASEYMLGPGPTHRGEPTGRARPPGRDEATEWGEAPGWKTPRPGGHTPPTPVGMRHTPTDHLPEAPHQTNSNYRRKEGLESENLDPRSEELPAGLDSQTAEAAYDPRRKEDAPIPAFARRSSSNEQSPPAEAPGIQRADGRVTGDAAGQAPSPSGSESLNVDWPYDEPYPVSLDNLPIWESMP